LLESHLRLLGVAAVLPSSREIEGGEGWPRVCVATETPSSMGARALDAALESAGLKPRDLSLVLACGMSRDHLPPWSVASEIMRLLDAGPQAMGFDLTIGCLGALTGFEVANGWLRGKGGGYAALVCAERWNSTVDYSDASAQALWGFSDGACAALVGLGAAGQAWGDYHGACFVSEASWNDLLHVPFREPFQMHLAPRGDRAVGRHYLKGYVSAARALKERFDAAADRVVCNQISPAFTAHLADVLGGVCVTGREYGHVGSADVLLGLKTLHDRGELRGNVYMAASTPSAFGCGLLTCS
jgi:3-oxoacyl-[acyl-carrier-protein] synthase III